MSNQQPLISVAVCEDDADLRDILASGLPHYGFRVFGVESAEHLDPLLANRETQLLILDLGLPGEDGYSVAQRMRREHPELGIVILTARGLLEERVRGLTLGADLYFVKPVDLGELSAAMVNLHRRIAHRKTSAVQAWRLNKVASVLETPAGHTVELSALELTLLDRMMAQPGETLDRQALCDALKWPADERVDHRLEGLISRLRKKVASAHPEEHLPIKARHGQGYAFLSEDGQTL
jgi:DNA-binding response OmpR family regulator